MKRRYGSTNRPNITIRPIKDFLHTVAGSCAGILAALLLISCGASSPAATVATIPPITPSPRTVTACPDAPGPLSGPIIFGLGPTLASMREDGGGLTYLFDLPADVWAHDPAWSADGQTLAFTLTQPTTDPRLTGLQIGMICGLDRATGKGRTLLRGSAPTESIEEASWAADGQALLVTTRQRKIDANNLYAGDTVAIARYDLRSGANQVLVTEATSPALSPDGLQLAFLRLDPQTGLFDLFIARSDGQDAQLVDPNTAPTSTVSAPRWSPDGSRLLFSASVEAAGEPTTSVSPRPLLERLFGAAVASAHGQPADLWIVGKDGQGAQRLTGKQLDDPRGAWSPDGRRLVYITGDQGVSLLDLESAQEQNLTDQGGYGGIAWAAR